jgi:hypothetical protein
MNKNPSRLDRIQIQLENICTVYIPTATIWVLFAWGVTGVEPFYPMSGLGVARQSHPTKGIFAQGMARSQKIDRIETSLFDSG